MAADETVVKQRVSEALNACAAGTFSTTIPANYLDRNATAISEAVREGALLIGRAVLSNPNHVHRNLYISGTPTSLTHAAELPDMAGEADLIEVRGYSSGSYRTSTPVTVQQIESWRDNPNEMYGPLGHDEQYSPISGYHAIGKGRIYFAGNAAQGYFPALSRSTAASLVADEYEGTWFMLGMGLSMKEGDNLFPIGQYYMTIGLRDLDAIATMSALSPVPTVDKVMTEAAARGNP